MNDRPTETIAGLGHRQLAMRAADYARSYDERQIDAQLAIYLLLDERLPESAELEAVLDTTEDAGALIIRYSTALAEREQRVEELEAELRDVRERLDRRKGTTRKFAAAAEQLAADMRRGLANMSDAL